MNMIFHRDGFLSSVELEIEKTGLLFILFILGETYRENYSPI